MKQARALITVFLLLLALVLLALLPSCDGEEETPLERQLRGELKRTEGQLEETRERLIDEQQRAGRETAAEKTRTEAAEQDFALAAAVCFGAVLASLLLVELLLREVATRRALTRLLRYFNREREERP